MLVVIGTDCIFSCKSLYHTITTTMAPANLNFWSTSNMEAGKRTMHVPFCSNLESSIWEKLFVFHFLICSYVKTVIWWWTLWILVQHKKNIHFIKEYPSNIPAKFAECHIGGHLEFSIDSEKRHLKDHCQRNISAMFVVLNKKLKKKKKLP